MAAQCREVRQMLTPGRTWFDIRECLDPPTRLVLIDEIGFALCLWHALVALERLGARLIPLPQ